MEISVRLTYQPGVIRFHSYQFPSHSQSTACQWDRRPYPENRQNQQRVIDHRHYAIVCDVECIIRD